MKINLHILLLGILLASALYSCNNEDDLDISEKKDNRFDLPQGDHDFDDQIVEWNNNYGTSVLYRFSNADLNYHFTSSSNDVVYDVKMEAEEEGIRAAVQFLKEDFFDLYSDEVKKELLANGASKIIHVQAKKSIEDWFLYDLDGILGFLRLGKNIKVSGKNGYDKLQRLYKQANKVYYKGIQSNGMIGRLDIEKIADAVKDQLNPLYKALDVDKN